MSEDVRPIGEDEVDDLQTLLEVCSDHAERVTGYPTGPSDALSTLLQRPEGVAEERKAVLGLWTRDGLAGCADVIAAYPDEDVATVGLLLVRPDLRRRGLGRRMHDAMLDLAATAGAERLRVGVIDTAADSVPFWTALGYRAEGDAVPYRYDHLVSTTQHWSRPVR